MYLNKKKFDNKFFLMLKTCYGCFKMFPAPFKTEQVLHLLKKGNLDPTISSNYRPISNLNTISKIIETRFFQNNFSSSIIS